MKRNSWSIAKVLILVFLVTGTTSLWYAKRLGAELDSASRKAVQLRKEQVALKAAQQALQEMLTPSAASSPPVETNLADTIVVLMKNRVEHGVSLSSVTSHKVLRGGTSVQPAANYVDKVPETSLKSIRINVKGTYEDYALLNRYLQVIRQRPLSIVFMKISGREFELGLRVYGM